MVAKFVKKEIMTVLDIPTLSAHTFITGSTGSGKSNTIYKILDELRKKQVKFILHFLTHLAVNAKCCLNSNEVCSKCAKNSLQKLSSSQKTDIISSSINVFSFDRYFVWRLYYIKKNTFMEFLFLSNSRYNTIFQTADFFQTKTRGKIFPIAKDSGDNYFCINIENDAVYYWDKEEDKYYLLTENFKQFIEVFYM